MFLIVHIYIQKGFVVFKNPRHDFPQICTFKTLRNFRRVALHLGVPYIQRHLTSSGALHVRVPDI